MKMKKCLEGVVVDKLLEQINNNPQLWNQHTLRTADIDSPHREVDDIWLRYNDMKNFDPDNHHLFADKHESVWYPAIEVLPEAKKIIENIMTVCDIDELGGCLITRIKPLCQVYRHNDGGFWHSEYYKDKFLILIESCREQAFCFDNECHSGVPGDVFIFDNRHDHWVNNYSSTINRISLILAGRKN